MMTDEDGINIITEKQSAWTFVNQSLITMFFPKY